MDIKTYVQNTERTRSKLDNKQLDNIHMGLGLITEAGELVDVLKKDLAYGKEIDWVNFQEEIGDILWYIAGLCNINGFDIEKIMDVNIDKLKARYPEKFTSENSIHRNLDKEREILEELGFEF
jgi:NTP pyrophosphatase (non-canonical NTP hydrolase)